MRIFMHKVVQAPPQPTRICWQCRAMCMWYCQRMKAVCDRWRREFVHMADRHDALLRENRRLREALRAKNVSHSKHDEDTVDNDIAAESVAGQAT